MQVDITPSIKVGLLLVYRHLPFELINHFVRSYLTFPQKGTVEIFENLDISSHIIYFNIIHKCNKEGI